jgi:hypothetical protein
MPVIISNKFFLSKKKPAKAGFFLSGSFPKRWAEERWFLYFFTSSNSTSKTSVAFGGIEAPAPFSP